MQCRLFCFHLSYKLSPYFGESWNWLIHLGGAMGIEDKLNRVSQLLERLLLQLETRSLKAIEKQKDFIDHPNQVLMKEFIEGVKSLRWLNGQLRNNEHPYYMGKDEVTRLTGMSASTLYRLEKKGEFPTRRRLGENSNRWLSTEVLEWINTREKIF